MIIYGIQCTVKIPAALINANGKCRARDNDYTKIFNTPTEVYGH